MVQLLWNGWPITRVSELGNLFQELIFLFDVLEHLFSCEHFVEYHSCTPHITFFIIRVQNKHFRSCIQRSTYSFCHLCLNIPSQTEVSNFQLSVLIEHKIIGFEISMDLIYFQNETILSELIYVIASRSCLNNDTTFSSDILALIISFRVPPLQSSRKQYNPSSLSWKPQQPIIF